LDAPATLPILRSRARLATGRGAGIPPSSRFHQFRPTCPLPRARLKTKLLFLCSRNQWRSPTAEALFRGHPRYEARSAGTVERARVKLTAGHIGWADAIFCMEQKHAAAVTARFGAELGDKPLLVLRIPDDYAFMDPDLVALLRSELAAHLSF
jgi:predicted protein tyrosine phosphatase